MAAAAVSTPAAWLRCVPQSADIIQSIRRSQQLELALKLPQKKLEVAAATRCSAHPSCAAAAVKWCEECGGEMCAAHDKSTHARSLSDHTRTPLAQKQAKQQAKLQSARAAAGADLKSDVDDAVDRLERVVYGDDARVEQKEREAEEVRAELAELRAKRTASKELLRDLRAGQNRLSRLSDADAQSLEAELDDLLEAASPPEDASVDLIDELTHCQLGQLLHFFVEADVPFGSPTLAYRGLRDGFKFSDFVRKCGGLSRTLTIVKAADNGFVFGAYTHCRWPAVNSVVADPTGKSFLFSLVNGSGSAVRFSLRDKDRAIRLSDCISFGAEKYEGDKTTGYPNFILMLKGAADQKNANAANALAADKAYQPDNGQACDATFLAGQQDFAAEQIEVYQL